MMLCRRQNRNDLAVEIEIDGLRSRVGREVEDDREWCRNAVLNRFFELAKKVEFRTDRHVAYRRARHDETEGMDRVAWVRHENDVAGRGDRLGEVGEPFFRAEGDDDLFFRVELDPEAPSVIGSTSSAQTGDAARDRVAMSSWILHRFNELGDDVRRRRPVGIAHAEIDDVASGGARLGFQRVDLGKDIRGKALDAIKLFGHDHPA